MNGDILRFVDAIHRDKSIDKSIIFKGIETALEKAAQKQLDSDEEINIDIDQETGDISATRNGSQLDPEMLGRIGAQTARQVMIQKIREAESESLYEDFKEKEGEIVSGSVSRFSGPNMLVTIGEVEAFFPKSQQVPGESYQVGDRLRALVKDVGKKGSKIMVELSRTHPDFIKRLFELEVPEIQEGVISIKGIASEPGNRTKVSVASNEEDVDAVGACVGVRGSRIKGIVAELNDERVDIIEWHPLDDQYIENSLKPADVQQVKLFEEDNLARVIVDEDQLSVAIGKGGQNVRLASKLTGWEIDVMSRQEEQELLEQEQQMASDEPEETPYEGAQEDSGEEEQAQTETTDVDEDDASPSGSESLTEIDDLDELKVEDTDDEREGSDSEEGSTVDGEGEEDVSENDSKSTVFDEDAEDSSASTGLGSSEEQEESSSDSEEESEQSTDPSDREGDEQDAETKHQSDSSE